MSDQEFGPALPPQYAAKKRVYGPSLPEKPMPDKEKSSDSEYEDIGPKISEFSENTEEPDEEVEKLTSWPVKTDSCKTKKSDREDWMSLPKKVANVQSAKRGFRKAHEEIKYEDVSKKQTTLKDRLENQKKVDEMAREYSTHGLSKTLIGIHNKDQEEKKEKNFKTTRQPFNRDTDLEIVKPGNSDPKKLATDSFKALRSRFAPSKD